MSLRKERRRIGSSQSDAAAGISRASSSWNAAESATSSSVRQ